MKTSQLIKAIREEQSIIKDAISLIEFAQAKIETLIADFEFNKIV